MSSLARRTPSSRNKYKQIEKQSILGHLMSAAARRSPCSRSKNKQIKRQEQIGRQDLIWILAEVTRVKGVTDDHLQEAGPSG